MKFPVPADEAERLRTLASLDLLNPCAKPELDDLAKLGAEVFCTSTCLVSVVGEHEQWFKGRHGTDLTGTSRDVSICTHTILSDDVLVMPDLARDPRFRTNPLVTSESGFRFYAGAPLADDGGVRLGAFCILDHVPRRSLTGSEEALLRRFAAALSGLMVTRRSEQPSHAPTRISIV